MKRSSATRCWNKLAAARSCAAVLAAAIVLTAALAAAQEAAKPAPPAPQGFFGTLSQWWEQTADTWNSGVTGIRRRFENLGQDAAPQPAAPSTMPGARPT